MTKHEALKQFKNYFNTKHSDAVMQRENWNNFTDFLCKSGEITLKQYETWTNPF